MKIIDSIPFWNEYDVLELRLGTMYDHVDEFIIVEGDRTYSGVYKGFNFEKHKDRYAPWLDKITYIKTENCPNWPNPWDNEQWQREQFSKVWDHVEKDDVIIVTDLDEIVRPEAIEFMRNTDYGFYKLWLLGAYFKFNYIDTRPVGGHYAPWGKAFRGWKSNHNDMRYSDGVPGKESVWLEHAGWHFGWIGDEKFVKNKLGSFSHSELNIPPILNSIDIDKHIAAGTDHIRPGSFWRPVKLDGYFPKYLLDNKEKFSQFILPDPEETVSSYIPGNILDIKDQK